MSPIDKFCINYYKRKIIDLGEFKEEFETFNPYKLSHLQQYNPTYSQFFDLNSNNYNNISLNHLHQIKNLHEVTNIVTQETIKKEIFIKFSPLLDPIRYMIGKYDLSNNNLSHLPTVTSENVKTNEKIALCNNASYVDNFFNFLTSILLNHHKFDHGIDYYGSFLGIQNKFKMNVEDDIEYLATSPFFLESIGKNVTLENFDYDMDGDSRTKKNKIVFDNKNNDIDIDCIIDLNVLDSIDINPSKIDEIQESNSIEYGILSTEELEIKKYDSDDDSDDSETNYSTSSESKEAKEEEDEDDISSSDESDDDTGDTIAYVDDFPVQMICLEKCEGTLDELFDENAVTDTNGASIFFQIIMILITYQKVFDFTHNDLHTNNIMYVKTNKKFLWYRYNKNYYKVPTYGRIYKIIDFGRSIYKFQKKQFYSDSFAPTGDGATQYNSEPFMNESKPLLKPNPSFDLCRLGCSVYDFLMDDESNKKTYNLRKIIRKWITDDKGHNIIYKRNGDERYPGFKLYKMISRTVHNATPQEQLKDPFFQQFLIKMKKVTNEIIDIDLLPSYV
jgi:hypothetical protein